MNSDDLARRVVQKLSIPSVDMIGLLFKKYGALYNPSGGYVSIPAAAANQLDEIGALLPDVCKTYIGISPEEWD